MSSAAVLSANGSIMTRLPNYSVVIATLGGPTLSATVACFLASVRAPCEILICIPEREQFRVNSLRFVAQVRIVPTRVRGQVAQRAVGFAEAKGELVLQCDDDITFDSSVTHLLIDALVALGPKNVVGPVFCNSISGTPIGHFATGLHGHVANLYFRLAGGLPWGMRRMGRFSSTTCAISIDPKYAGAAVVGVDWLAGGFVLGWRTDLVLGNFYPFPGKAYCEDLLHALERARIGVKHNVVTRARVLIEVLDNSSTMADLKRELVSRYRVGRLIGASSATATMFVVLEGTRRILQAISRKLFDISSTK